MTAARSFKVTVQRWEDYYEVEVEGVGVTQSEPNATDAELMACDLIAAELGLMPGTYRVDLDTRKVSER